MKNHLEFLKPISTRGNLANKAYAILKNSIINGQIPLGSWLMEDEVTKQLSISRTPVREAFKRLHGDGLIQIIPRKGARIPDITMNEMEELLDAREHIETAFFYRSAQNINQNELKKFAADFHKLEKKLLEANGDFEKTSNLQSQYIKIDRAFHDFLIEASGNRYWIDIYHGLRNKIQFSAFKAGIVPFQFEKAFKEHNAIIDAILAKEIPKARKILLEHIRDYKTRLLSVMRRQDTLRNSQ